MYMTQNDPRLDGWLSDKFKQVKNVVQQAAKVVTAPLKIVSAGVQGKSMSTAFDQNVTQVVGAALKNPGVVPLLKFIPGVGTAVAGAASLALAADKLKKQREAEKAGTAKAAALDKEIADTNAKIAALRKNETLTAGGAVGAAVAMRAAPSPSAATWWGKPWGKTNNAHAARYGAERASLMGFGAVAPVVGRPSAPTMKPLPAPIIGRPVAPTMKPIPAPVVGKSVAPLPSAPKSAIIAWGRYKNAHAERFGANRANLHGMGGISDIDWGGLLETGISTAISTKAAQLKQAQANALALEQSRQAIEAQTAIQTAGQEQSIKSSTTIKLATIGAAVAVGGGILYAMTRRKARA